MSWTSIAPTVAGALLGLAIAWLPPGSTSADFPRWLPVTVAAVILCTRVRGLDRWDAAMLVLPGVMGLAALSSTVPGLGAWGTGRSAVLAALVIGARRLDGEQARTLAMWIAGGALLQAGLGLGQALGFAPAGAAVLQTADATYAVQGTLGHRNVLAGTLAVAAPLAWLGVHPLLGVALALGAVGTGSAGAFLGLGMGAAVLGWQRLPERWRWPGAAGLFTLTAVGIGVVAATGASGRVPIWRTAFDLFLAHPVLGVGPAQLGNVWIDATLDHLHDLGAWDTGGTAARHAHLEVLNAAVEAGLPGALAWLLAWVAPLGRWVGRERSPVVLAAGASVGIALGHGLVSFPVELAVPGSVVAIATGLALGAPAASRGPGWLLVLLPLLAALPLGRRALADRDVAEARAWALEDPSRAIAAAERALAWFPDEGQAAYWMGTALRVQGELPRAEAMLRESLRTNDHHVGRRDLGLLLAELGRSEEAVPWLEDYVWVHPGSSPRPYLVLGAAYVDLERWEDAVDAFDRCQCTEGFHRSGDLLMYLERPTEALYRWRQAGDDEAILKQIAHLLSEGDEATAKPLLLELESDAARTKGVGTFHQYRMRLPAKSDLP